MALFSLNSQLLSYGFLMIRRPPRSTLTRSSAASDVYKRQTINDGTKVFVGIAGLAAHLSGNIAAHTTLPVIGIPGDGGPLNGLDALFSTVQMPRGVPVATVAIGKAGAVNAGHLAAQMLATGDDDLAKKIADQREEQKRILLEDQ